MLTPLGRRRWTHGENTVRGTKPCTGRFEYRPTNRCCGPFERNARRQDGEAILGPRGADAVVVHLLLPCGRFGLPDATVSGSGERLDAVVRNSTKIIMSKRPRPGRLAISHLHFDDRWCCAHTSCWLLGTRCPYNTCIPTDRWQPCKFPHDSRLPCVPFKAQAAIFMIILFFYVYNNSVYAVVCYNDGVEKN